MKLVALGANLPSRFGTPEQTLYAALTAMARRDIWPVGVSRLWRTAPVPADPEVPWYFNAVAEVKTDMQPRKLLRALLSIEEEFGRVRTYQNAPRVLDLDLVSYDKRVEAGRGLILPHPRMDGRGFVLLPMKDILEDWAHPITGKTLDDLIAALPEDQIAEPVENGWDNVG